MMTKMIAAAGLALAMCGVAGAQAPAGAPAGANGICKDGTYSTAASKQGACRGHNGVQTWYAAAPAAGAVAKPSAPAMPSPAAVPSVPSRPAPTPSVAAPSAPAPTASTAATPAGGAKRGPAASAASKAQAAGGGPGLVWVNTESNVYHCNGDTYYGKTKAGQYMSEADAKAKGAHGDHGKVCTGK